jgi:hypothetical protein
VNRRVIIGLTVVAITVAAAAGTVLAKSGPLSADLQAVRAAVAKYHDYAVAEADGYSLAGEPCVSSPDGTMGFHASNQAIIRSGVMDPLRPPILLYAPNQDGKLKLVAVEYFKPDADQDLATDNDRPSIFGRAFEGPMLGHNPTMPIHYDLHLWFWADNPAGFFAPFNPSLSCPS